MDTNTIYYLKEAGKYNKELPSRNIEIGQT